MPASVTALPPSGSPSAYADVEVERRFTRPVRQGTEACFLIQGIRCGGCALSVERAMRRLPGMVQAEVNFATQRARAVWDPERIKLSDVLHSIENAGYGARPYDPLHAESRLAAERRERLYRLGIAGLFGMQVMTISFALYAGEFFGMEAELRPLLRWFALILTIPVIVYCGTGFFAGAVRDLRRLRAGMDVPVSLGLLVAFLGSFHATVRNQGDVYFDSVVMFVFFLLLARYLEFCARARHERDAESLVTEPPATATRVTILEGVRTEDLVLASGLSPGDRIYVGCGETIPADGIIELGTTTVDESILTGECRPLPKCAGAEVIAGSINTENPVEIRVTRGAKDSTLAQVKRLMDRARLLKPRAVHLADKAASCFVAVVLLIASGVALYWWRRSPEEWLPVTIAVLVVTCPCALSLATPSAFTAAVGALARRGLVVTRGHALEMLAGMNRLVLDKTGTLTRGRLRLVAMEVYVDTGSRDVRRIASSLERGSNHPVGRAIAACCDAPPWPVEEISVTPGLGIAGTIHGRPYAIGSAEFMGRRLPHEARPAHSSPQDESATLVYLADDSRVIARFSLDDELRPDAGTLVEGLRERRIPVSLLSGDRVAAVNKVAACLGIDDAHGELLPEQKLARLRELQHRGEVVAAAGDGINDGPLLAGADVSVAMGSGPRATQASADLILLSDRLSDLAAAVDIARRMRRVIIQNLTWAAGYNLIALPAAALGLLPPWLAALGMSLSSIVVVLNSLRAGRTPSPLARPG